MAKTKAQRILELESMLEATSNSARHLSDYRDRREATLKEQIAALTAQNARLLAYVRALAVLDRLDTMPGVTSVTMWREWGVCVVKATIDAGPVGSMRGEGPTPAAALLALGARLEGDE